LQSTLTWPTWHPSSSTTSYDNFENASRVKRTTNQKKKKVLSGEFYVEDSDVEDSDYDNQEEVLEEDEDFID
jgi:hypothetical protein